MTRQGIVALALGCSLIGGAVAAQDRAPSAQERITRGQRMFMEQGCYGCHTVQKLGTPIGPDLSHLGARYSESYLRNWLRDPAQQRPATHMPQLELTEPQIAAIAAFLASLE
jgi:mono/diheme cytochrome c family protein